MPLELSFGDIAREAERLADRWRGKDVAAVHGIPRGGCVPAALVAANLGVPLTNDLGPAVLIVDDLVDSGATATRYNLLMFDALYRKSWSPPAIAPHATAVADEPDTGLPPWLVFPWEVDETSPEDSVTRIIQYLGEDPTRPGLADTPKRVLKALSEMTSGYRDDPAILLATQFPDDYDEMIVVSGIGFHSLCEHHLLGFTGTATVAYIPQPGRGVVGLSKLARLVECYARRLQVQERMTKQIATAIQDHLAPLGVGVVVRARHSCMGCRGIRKPEAEMVTSSLHGYMKDRPEVRAEFLALSKPN